MDRRANYFDELRLLAAWLVLFSHCYPLSGSALGDPFARSIGIDTLGGVGVAIFFVLSGYLVTLSWERSTGTIDFFWKRARRIYPALGACVCVCVCVIGFWLSSLDPAAFFQHPQTREYFKTATAWSIKFVLPGAFPHNPLPGTVNGSLWSLPYELRCYLCLALLGLLPIALRWKVAATTTLLALYLFSRPQMPVFDRYLGIDYYHAKLGLFFAIGATYASWRKHIRPMCWLGLAGTVAACTMADSSVRTIVWVVSFSTFALGVALVPWHFPKLPERMGDWSYGLYLYGFPTQQVVAHFDVAKSLSLPGYVVVCTFASLTLAALSWFVVERPALAFERKGARQS